MFIDQKSTKEQKPQRGIRVKLSGLNLSQHSQRIYSFVTFAFEALSHDKRRGVL